MGELFTSSRGRAGELINLETLLKMNHELYLESRECTYMSTQTGRVTGTLIQLL